MKTRGFLQASEAELKEEICRVMKLLYYRGLVSALGGNVSARVPGSKEFWITPSGVFKGALKPEDLIKLDLEGKRIEGSMKPSIEWPMHAAIYRARPDVNAVVHAHNPYTLGLTLAGIELKPVSIEAIMLIGKKVEVLPFAFPGTEKLARLVGKHVAKGAKALILRNHGVVAIGTNLLEAEAVVEVLEEISISQYIALSLGKEPPMVPVESTELFEGTQEAEQDIRS